MQQTLFSVLSLGLVLLFALNSNKERTERISNTVSGALEIEARGVATQVLDHLGGFAFDGNSTATTPTGFTPETDFGPVGRSYDDPAIADIDDFHRIATHRIDRSVSDPESGGETTLAFAVNIAVQYVDVSATEVVASGGIQTYDKQVLVTVSHDQLIQPVTLSRVYSYSR